MYLSTSTEDFPEMYLSTFQVLYKLYLSTDVLKYKVLLPGSATERINIRDNAMMCETMKTDDARKLVFSSAIIKLGCMLVTDCYVVLTCTQ